MKFSEEELKRIYQRGTARRSPKPQECLSAETFERASMNEIDSYERERMVSHLMVCSDCTREYRAVLSLRSTFEQPLSGKQSIPVPLSQRLWERFSSSGWRIAAALSTVLLVAAVSLTLWLNSRRVYPPPQTERGGVATRLAVEPSDKAQLSEAPQMLEWSAVERAESYTVALYDYESTLIWKSSTVISTSITLPETVRNDIKPGKLYYWQVTVQEGIESRLSNVFQFTVRGDASR